MIVNASSSAPDRKVAALDDGRLLAGDRLDRRPQAIRVVQGDIGDGGDAAVPCVCRVEATPQPDLDQGHIDISLGEVPEDDRGGQPEFGRLPCLLATRSATAKTASTFRVKSATEIGWPSTCTRSR